MNSVIEVMKKVKDRMIGYDMICDKMGIHDKKTVNDFWIKYDEMSIKKEREEKSGQIYCVLDEKYNSKKLYEFLIYGAADEDYYKQLNTYMASSKRVNKETNICKVSYSYPENCIGRFRNMVINNKKKQIRCDTQTNMWNELKRYILKDYIIDVDMVNCHHAIIENLTDRYNIENKKIKKYNSNRDMYMKQIMNIYTCNKKDAKIMVLRHTYGYDSKMNGNEFKNFPKDVKEFIYETKRARDILLERYPEYIEESKKRSEKKPEKNGRNDNLLGSSWSLLLQTYERRCLECMHQYFKKNGLNVTSLIFDGQHCEKSDKINQEFLDNCSKHIKKELGLDIKISIKEFEDLDLSTLEVKRKFDPLNVEELEDRKMVKYINCDKISPLNGDPFENVKIVKKNGKLKPIILIKSFTGSGKSYFLRQVQKYINDNKETIFKMKVKKTKPRMYFDEDGLVEEDGEEKTEIIDVKVVSLVSRVSLSYSHEKDFGLRNYQKVPAKEHGLDEVYQIDSLLKFNTSGDNGYFILMLDEVSSLISHINNHMKHMSMNRLTIINKLREIINNDRCVCIVGVDDNLNTATINFLEQLTKKQIEVYINKRINRFIQPVNIHTNIDHIIKQLKDAIKSGKKIYCCSNLCGTFFEKVIRPIIKELGLQKHEYLIYSGNYGEKVKFDPKDAEGLEIQKGDIMVCKWNNPEIKIIFASPSILYGISYDLEYTHAVYGFYFRRGPLSSLDLNQQLNRIRCPTSFELYIEREYVKPKKLDDIRNEEYSKCKDVHNDKLEDYIARIADTDLMIYDDYIKSHFDDLFYYIPFLLKKKGYTNINIITEGEEKQTKLSKKEHVDLLVKEYEEGVLDEKKADSITIFMRSFGFDKKIVNTDPELKEIEKSIRDNAMEIFVSDSGMRCLNLYKKFKSGSYEEDLNQSKDSDAMVNRSENKMLKTFKYLHDILEIEPFNRNLENELKNTPSDQLFKSVEIENIEELKKELRNRNTFRCEISDTRWPITRIGWIGLVTRLYRIFGSEVVKTENQNFSREGLRFTIGYTTPYLDKLDMILEYETEIRELKERMDANKKEEYGEYAFE